MCVVLHDSVVLEFEAKTVIGDYVVHFSYLLIQELTTSVFQFLQIIGDWLGDGEIDSDAHGGHVLIVGGPLGACNSSFSGSDVDFTPVICNPIFALSSSLTFHSTTQP